MTAKNELVRASRVIKKCKELGIVTEVKIDNLNYPDEPFAHTSEISPHGYGIDFFSVEKAVWSALGENVERWLWFNADLMQKTETVMGTFKELKDKALDPFSFSGFTSEQRKNHREKLFFDENTSFTWIATHSLTEKKMEVYCPLQLISAKHLKELEEPKIRWSVTTGLATGPTLDDAILAGILEIIERDAFMINYLNKLSPPQYNLEQVRTLDENIDSILKQCERYNLKPYILQLVTDFPVTVALTILYDPSGKGPSITVGARASFNTKKAIIDSITEAFIVRFYAKKEKRKDVSVKNMGRVERISYWAHKANLQDITFMIEGEVIPTSFENKSGTVKEQLQTLTTVLKEKKYNAVYIELTTKSTRNLPIHSVMTIIPQLQPLHLYESIPCIGGKRLKSVPEKMGFESAKSLNTIPHPFP